MGVEKMTAASSFQVGDNLLGASYWREEGALHGGFAGIFGQIVQRYFEVHGDQSDALARPCSCRRLIEGAVYNMGGSGVAYYVSMLQAHRG